jgi:hypothetical protein
MSTYPQYTLQSQDVYKLTINTLDTLPLTMPGAIQSRDLLRVLVFAAAARLSVHQACDQLEGAPAGPTMLGTPYGRFTFHRPLQACPMKFMDLTSLTLDEFQRLIVPFEVAFQAHMAAWRLDGKSRTTLKFTLYQNCPRPPLRIGHCLFSPMSRPTRRRPGTPVKHIVPASPFRLQGHGFQHINWGTLPNS